MVTVVDIRAFQTSYYSGVHTYGRDLVEELVKGGRDIVFFTMGRGAPQLPKYFEEYVAMRRARHAHLPLSTTLFSVIWFFLNKPTLNLLFKLFRLPDFDEIVVLDPRPTPVSEGVAKYIVVHDCSMERHPETFSFRSRVRFFLLQLKKELRGSHVIAVSRFTANELAKFYSGFASCTVRHIKRITYEKWRGSTLKSFSIKKNDRYLLALATLQPRKRLYLVQKLFLEGAFGEFDYLVCVGKRDDRTFSHTMYAHDDKIKYTGYVSEADKAALFANASAFVSLSQYEGFGIPVREAIHYSLPLFLSEIPAHKEAVGSYKNVTFMKEDYLSRFA